MKTRHWMFLILTALVAGAALAACTAVRPSGEVVRQLSPSVSLQPSSTPTLAPTPSPTSTRIVRPTASPRPTLTPRSNEPTSTPIPAPSTAVPIAEDNSFYQDIKAQGYSLFYSASTTGPQGYTYSAYLFADPSFRIDEKEPWVYREWSAAEGPEGTPGCLLAIYRSDGEQNVLLYSFTAPRYPEGSAYSHYPTSCSRHDWYDVNVWYIPPGDPEFYQYLGLKNAWSDINQNGLPEFSVVYQYCDNGCLNYGALDTHFYEIQSTSKVVDITADLPGTIITFNLFYSWDPLVFLVYDPSKTYCYRCNLDSWWLYAWDGEKLANVTHQYPQFARERGAEFAEGVKKWQRTSTGSSLWPLLEILFVYEKAGLSQEGLELFLELTEPADWPKVDHCWLQIARAAEQEDFANHRPFHLVDEDAMGGLDRELEKIDRNKYDVSVCYP